MPRAALVILLIFLAAGARAEMPALPGLDRPALTGQATMRWLGIRIYDAELFTERGARYRPGDAAALRLRYRKGFARDVLVGSTMDELERLERRRGDHPALRGMLYDCFADVAANDSFVALTKGADRIRFYLNGRQTCRLSHPGIGTRILAIWLSPDSRRPDLSRKLLGEAG